MPELYHGTLTARQTHDEGDFAWYMVAGGVVDGDDGAVAEIDASEGGYIILKNESVIQIFPETGEKIKGDELVLNLTSDDSPGDGGYYQLVGNYGEYHDGGRAVEHNDGHYTFVATLGGTKPDKLWFGIKLTWNAGTTSTTSKIDKIDWSYRSSEQT